MSSITVKINNCVDCNKSRAECYDYDHGTGGDYIKYYCTLLEDEGDDGFLGETKRKNNYISIPDRCPYVVRKKSIKKFFRKLKVEIIFEVIKDLPTDYFINIKELTNKNHIIEFEDSETRLTSRELRVILSKFSISYSYEMEDLEDIYLSINGQDKNNIDFKPLDIYFYGNKSNFLRIDDYLKLKLCRIYG